MKATAGEQMGLGTEQTERGLSALLGRMTDGFSKLVTQHLALARLELMDDARAMGTDVARIAAFVPFVLVGYAFLCAALSAFLARWIGWDGSLAVVGALNLVVGGVGIAQAAMRIKARRLMDDTTEELSRSVEVLAQTQAPVPQLQPAVLPRESGHGR
jgi:hypothetical protein